jgi:hypothetical protein
MHSEDGLPIQEQIACPGDNVTNLSLSTSSQQFQTVAQHLSQVTVQAQF